ncbi:aminoglycoside phosphotransferase family protein [Chloroflexi bacterium TSY]|nr:aminoglycoside phosphotransferase family protein [Chloroflexi bacterium TSY]
MKLSIAQVEEYLSRHFDEAVHVLTLTALGDDEISAISNLSNTDDTDRTEKHNSGSLKTFGYGEPILVTYKRQGALNRLVFSTVAANHFGHEDRADRVAEIIRSYEIYNTLPQHARALDIGMIAKGNHLQSLAGGREFFLLTEHVKGKPYAHDLERLRNTGEITGLDLRRAYQLALYLAEIHSVKRNDPPLYVRRIRDTLGSGEGIMGLIDSYQDDFPFATPQWLEMLEKLCVTWRWKLKQKAGRLAQVHGDFHPFNLLFDRGIDFNILDRSRGAWGEPADDVVCMVINYLFFSLQRTGKLAPPFEQLWNIFWNTYLQESKDSELTSVVAPFFAWRALVLASPVWYNVADSVRQSLLKAAESVLKNEVFDPAEINGII